MKNKKTINYQYEAERYSVVQYAEDTDHILAVVATAVRACCPEQNHKSLNDFTNILNGYTCNGNVNTGELRIHVPVSEPIDMEQLEEYLLIGFEMCLWMFDRLFLFDPDDGDIVCDSGGVDVRVYIAPSVVLCENFFTMPRGEYLSMVEYLTDMILAETARGLASGDLQPLPYE